MPGARNSRKDKERLERIRQSASSITDDVVELGVDEPAIEDASAARSLDAFVLMRRVREAFEKLLGAEELWIDDMGVPSFSIEATLPIEQAAVIREPINNQLWRIPWTVNDDDTITISPRTNWERVTHEYVAVANPTQPNTPPQAMRAFTGSFVRVVAETPDTITVGGYGVRFFGTDLLGTRFMPDTDFGVYIRSGNLPVYYDHTLTGPPQHSLGTVVKAVTDEDGLWIEAQLNRHAAYVGEVLKLIDQGVLGWSSGSAPHLVRLAGDNSTWRSWPIIEFSLTPTPGEPRTLGVQNLSQQARSAPQDRGGDMAVENTTPQEGAAPNEQQPQAHAPAPTPPEPQQPTNPPAASPDLEAIRTMFTEVVTGHIAPLREELDAMRSAPAPRNTGGVVTPQATETPAERAVRRFNTYVRQGPFAVRDLQEDVGIEGGVLVPSTYSDELIVTLQEQQSVLRLAGARQITLAGTNSFSVPTMTNSGPAQLTREEKEFAENTPSLGEVVFFPSKYTTRSKVSDELLQDARFDVVNNVLIPNAVQGFADAENAVFLTGSGASEPQGLITGGSLGATSTKATIEYDDIVNLVYSLSRFHRQRAVFITNDSTIGALRKIKDSFGNPIWEPSLTADAPDRLMGKMIYTMDGVSGVEASAKVLVIANLDRFWIADFSGMEMKRLDELYSANGQVGFRWYRRMDSRVVDSTAVKYLQMKA